MTLLFICSDTFSPKFVVSFNTSSTFSDVDLLLLLSVGQPKNKEEKNNMEKNDFYTIQITGGGGGGVNSFFKKLTFSKFINKKIKNQIF
jgi:hypothetical protein